MANFGYTEVKEEECDSESEDVDVSPFLLTPISFRSLIGHDDEVNTCCFSPDWTRLVSGGDDWVVKMWDTATGKPVYTLTSHKGELKMLTLGGFPHGHHGFTPVLHVMNYISPTILSHSFCNLSV